jgi:CubicO group peptidase (beta-lactamase class C family)
MDRMRETAKQRVARIDQVQLDYEAPVARYWPELRAARDGLTVGQLLSHQGGLPAVRQRILVEDPYEEEDGRSVREGRAALEAWQRRRLSRHTWGYLAGELALRTTGRSLGLFLPTSDFACSAASMNAPEQKCWTP